jgi:DNA primase
LGQALREPEEYPLIIVEGFFDLMKLWQLGIRKTVALMGSSMSVTQEQLITRVTNEDSSIIVMFDEDDAGRSGRADVLQRLATKAFVRIVTFGKEGFQPEQLTPAQVADLHLAPE